MVDLGSRSTPGLSKSAFPPWDLLGAALLPAKPPLVLVAPATPCKQCHGFTEDNAECQQGPRVAWGCTHQKSPLSSANTRSVFNPQPQPSHSISFHPSWREESLTALRNLPERDRILPRATAWRSQDRFSVTEKCIKSTLPQHLLAEEWGMKGQHSCSSGTLWGLGDSDICATLHHLTVSPRLSNAIISSGLAGKLD